MGAIYSLKLKKENILEAKGENSHSELVYPYP